MKKTSATITITKHLIVGLIVCNLLALPFTKKIIKQNIFIEQKNKKQNNNNNQPIYTCV